HRRAGRGVQRDLPAGLRVAHLPQPHHPGNGDQPCARYASLWPTWLWKNTHCKKNWRGAERAGAQDRERPRDPGQVRGRRGGEDPRAVRGRRARA
ncbi:unnamed protein product, partial [Heterosigma akashiwo]